MIPRTGTARRGASVRARELGARLRVQREQHDLSGRALARRVDWPEAKVCMIETGSRPPSSVDVAAYLAGCGPIDRPEYKNLVALAKEHDDGYLVRPRGPELPGELRSLIVAQSTATWIVSFEPLVIPGLLQTEAYIRELFRWGSDRSNDEVELRVRARLAKQEVLRQRLPPSCTFFVAEHALRTVVGRVSLMSEQMLHLVLATHDAHCSIRVVPGAAAPFGSVGGMFMLLGYHDHDPIAYTETWTTGLFMEKPHDVALYRKVESKLDAHALSARQSRAWLADMASAYDRVEANTSCPPASRTG